MKKISTKSNFLFKTKADTLKQLVKLVKQSKIEKIYVFTVEEWKSSRTTILKYISNNFDKKIIVRSSARGEDSLDASQAGKFQTIFNIKSTEKNEIKNAVNQIINSYITKGKDDELNQVLKIQVVTIYHPMIPTKGQGILSVKLY